MQPLTGTEPEHQLLHGWIGGDALRVPDRTDEPWCGQNLETLVDADEELGRLYRALDRAKLRAFDLSRN